MSQNLSNKTQEETAQRKGELTATGMILAGTLWGIERFGQPYAQQPAPIYIDMAWQLQTDKSLRDALRTVLDAIDLEQPK